MYIGLENLFGRYFILDEVLTI
uniref:Uncharacterized protein n=1 Tax=Rhizophora mucronata TaxID=61149 RepID=A0A2P2NRN4_RHIMU